jgi:hypothetical protein
MDFLTAARFAIRPRRSPAWQRQQRRKRPLRGRGFCCVSVRSWPRRKASRKSRECAVSSGARNQKNIGAGGGSRTHTALRPADFLARYGFRRPLRMRPGSAPVEVWGLDYPFTVPRTSGGRCCPSSLYTFPKRRFGLGSGLPVNRFPRL